MTSCDFRISVILLAMILSSTAHGHVTMDPTVAKAGQYAKIVFRVPHGCNASPTTAITVSIPEGVVSVKPQVHPGWKISTKTSKLAKPVSLHGKPVTESVSEVTWTGGPLPEEYMDEFGVSLKLPDQPGKTLNFPVLQKCQKGSANWNQISGAVDGHMEFPAPALNLETGDSTHSSHTSH